MIPNSEFGKSGFTAISAWLFKKLLMPVLPLIANKDPREVVELKSHQRVLTALQK